MTNDHGIHAALRRIEATDTATEWAEHLERQSNLASRLTIAEAHLARISARKAARAAEDINYARASRRLWVFIGAVTIAVWANLIWMVIQWAGWM